MSDDPATLSATFLWDGAGRWALARHILATEPELAKLARRARRLMLLTAVVWAPPTILITHYFVQQVAPGPDTARFGWLLGVLIVVLGLMAVYSWSGPWHSFHSALWECPLYAPWQSRRNVTVTASAPGITIAITNHSTTYPWKLFDQVVQVPGFIAVTLTNTGSGITIPLAAFQSPEAASMFQAGLHELMTASGHERTSRVTSQLREHSILCGACGHDLRGLETPRCPECGRGLTVLSLTIFTALQLPWWRLMALGGPKRGPPDQYL